MLYVIPDIAVNGNAYVLTSRAKGILTNIPANVSYVLTGGYNTAGDGGNAQFMRVAGPLADGASFQSADGAWWKVINLTEANILVFGAVVGANSYNAIVNAIAYAAANDVPVTIPAHTFLTDASINVAAGVDIVGYDKASSIIQASNAANLAQGILILNNNHHLDNFIIDGNKANNGANYGLWAEVRTGIQVGENFTSQNTLQAGGYFDGCTYTNIAGHFLNNGVNAGTDNHGVMIISTAGRTTTFVTCTATVQNAFRKGIALYIQGNGILSDVTIADFNVSGCGLGGVYVAPDALATDRLTRITVAGGIAFNNYVNIDLNEISYLDFRDSRAVMNSGGGAGAGQPNIQLNGCTQGVMTNVLAADGRGHNIRLINCQQFIFNNLQSINGNSQNNAFAGGIACAGVVTSNFSELFIADGGAKVTYGFVFEDGNSNSVTNSSINNGTVASYLDNGSNYYEAVSVTGKQYGTPTDPKIQVTYGQRSDVGAYNSPTTNLNLVNGNNDNVAKPSRKNVYVNGPTGAFAITGFAGGVDGDEIFVHNYNGNAISFPHQSAGSAAGNKLFCPGAVTFTPGTFSTTRLCFVGTANGWFVS